MVGFIRTDRTVVLTERHHCTCKPMVNPIKTCNANLQYQFSTKSTHEERTCRWTCHHFALIYASERINTFQDTTQLTSLLSTGFSVGPTASLTTLEKIANLLPLLQIKPWFPRNLNHKGIKMWVFSFKPQPLYLHPLNSRLVHPTASLHVLWDRKLSHPAPTLSLHRLHTRI